MRLTPIILEAAYEFLRCTPPFNKWNLPEADEIEFHVVNKMRPERHFADCGIGDSGEWCIRVAAKRHRHTQTVLMSMAHEMVHLHQMIRQLETPNTQHNADFWKRAATVCRHHGWDAGLF